MPATVNHGPIGYCIYCGATSPDLSREHIVPLSLGGNHVLLEASCEQCARTINEFETFCAHTLFGPYRVRGDLPTRRPKERPRKLPLGLMSAEGTPYNVDIPPSEHPATLLMPIFAKPRLLMLPGEERRETFRMWFALPDTDVFKLPQAHNSPSMLLGTFEILNFCRLLAKIAHAASFIDHKDGFMHRDWSKVFEPLLPPLILREITEYDMVIGGTDETMVKPEDAGFPLFFETLDVEAERYLVAQLRLFAHQGTPTYRVVVGKRRSGQGGEHDATSV